VRKAEKGRARSGSGRTANGRSREMSQARNNIRAQAGEAGRSRRRRVQDARTEKKAKQLLWDFWPLRNKKFQRTEFHCHSSSSILAYAFHELP